VGALEPSPEEQALLAAVLAKDRKAASGRGRHVGGCSPSAPEADALIRANYAQRVEDGPKNEQPHDASESAEPG
jgi:hypothetical protein